MKTTMALIVLLCLSTQAIAKDNVVLLLDDSGSMATKMRNNRGRLTRIDTAHKALITVIDQIPDNTDVGLLTFGGWIYNLGPVNREELKALVLEITPVHGTPLGEYMKIGADVLLKKREKEQYGKFKLVVVTDGEASDPHLLEAYLPDILGRGLIVDVVGLDMASTHSLKNSAHSYASADDQESLVNALKSSLAEVAVGDGIEENFDMIASLPDDLAKTIIDTVTKSRNHPIGESELVKVVDAQGNVKFVKAAPVAPPAATMGLLMIILIFIVVIVVLFLGFILLMNA